MWKATILCCFTGDFKETTKKSSHFNP